jgi:hypothetical protein
VAGSELAWVGATIVGSSGFVCLFVRWVLSISLVCVAIALVDDIFEVKRCVKCGCKLDCR